MFLLRKFGLVVACAMAVCGAFANPGFAQTRKCSAGEQVSLSGTIYHIHHNPRSATILLLNRGETTGTCSTGDIIFEAKPPSTCVRGADFTMSGKAISDWRVVAASLECRAGPAVLIFFEDNQSDLQGDGLALIDTSAGLIKSSAARLVWLIGYADAAEHEKTPKKLPIARAEFVKAALVMRGVAAEKIIVMTSDMSEMPVKTPANVKEPQNRRVFVRIIK